MSLSELCDAIEHPDTRVMIYNGRLIVANPFWPVRELTRAGMMPVPPATLADIAVGRDYVHAFASRLAPEGSLERTDVMTCPACDGSGSVGVYSDDGSPHPCGECNGDGLVPKSPVSPI